MYWSMLGYDTLFFIHARVSSVELLVREVFGSCRSSCNWKLSFGDSCSKPYSYDAMYFHSFVIEHGW